MSCITQCNKPRLSKTCAEMSWLAWATMGKRDSTALPWWPCLVNRVPAVGDFLPYRVGDELVLRLDGPVAVAPGVTLMHALHLLQEQDVRGEPMQPFAQLVDDHPPGQVRKPLVDVVGGDGEAHGEAAESDARPNGSGICRDPVLVARDDRTRGLPAPLPTL